MRTGLRAPTSGVWAPSDGGKALFLSADDVFPPGSATRDAVDWELKYDRDGLADLAHQLDWAHQLLRDWLDRRPGTAAETRVFFAVLDEPS